MATRKDIKAAAVEAAEQNREQAKARVEELAAMDPATRKAAKASDKAAAKAAKAADKAERKAARAKMTRKERRADRREARIHRKVANRRRRGIGWGVTAGVVALVIILAGVFAFIRARTATTPNTSLAWIITTTFLLAVTTELLGRGMHYEGLWHIGLNTTQTLLGH